MDERMIVSTCSLYHTVMVVMVTVVKVMVVMVMVVIVVIRVGYREPVPLWNRFPYNRFLRYRMKLG